MNDVDPETREALIEAARAARAQAYAPYSKFAVGAAVLLDEGGRIFSGANVENASYGLTNCAERAAVFTAVSHGARRLRAIAIVSATGVPPCGACRQVLSEFTGDDFEIFVADSNGAWRRYTADELWPHMFTRDDLRLTPPPAATEPTQEREAQL
ncbi:MAG: cytidine deaminase [Chloroflexi bacterium]|nr:cytidine deaminase [Chloroflexota bacterium]